MNENTDELDIDPAEHRRKLVKQRLESLIRSSPQLYYEATSVVARALHEDIQSEPDAGDSDNEILAKMTVREIELVLAFK